MLRLNAMTLTLTKEALIFVDFVSLVSSEISLFVTSGRGGA